MRVFKITGSQTNRVYYNRLVGESLQYLHTNKSWYEYEKVKDPSHLVDYLKDNKDYLKVEELCQKSI